MGAKQRFALHMDNLFTYPLLLTQGLYAFARTPRLLAPTGENAGAVAGDAPTLRLLVLGESPVAGVGVDSAGEALTAQTALALRAATGRMIRWRGVGQMGATVRLARAALVARIPAGEEADVCVVALGVNDALRLNAPTSWAREMSALVDDLRRVLNPSLIMLAAVPPVGQLTALPQPLRARLGRHAGRLDAALQRVAQGQDDIVHVPMPFEGGADFLAADGFHPSALGYRAWGRQLAERMAEAMVGCRATRKYADSKRGVRREVSKSAFIRAYLRFQTSKNCRR